MSQGSPHLQNTESSRARELQQNTSGSDFRNNVPSLTSVMSATSSASDDVSSTKHKAAFHRAYGG